MNTIYTPLDPVIWSIFAAFLVATYLIIKMYQRRYPNYPNDVEQDKD
jgi:hypothetical protein